MNAGDRDGTLANGLDKQSTVIINTARWRQLIRFAPECRLGKVVLCCTVSLSLHPRLSEYDLK